MSDNFITAIRIEWEKVPESSYVRNIEALRSADEIALESPVTFLVGENGSGKSTLLEAVAIAAGFNPEGGTRANSFSTYDSHSELCRAISLTKSFRRARGGYFLRAESFYNVASMEAEANKLMGGRPQHLHERSHGESFLYIAQNLFGANGLYMLDEPEAALSPQRQLALLVELDRCVKAGAQFIVATHSPIILGFPNASILSFDGGRIHRCEYEDTESVSITRLFLSDRERILHRLLCEE